MGERQVLTLTTPIVVALKGAGGKATERTISALSFPPEGHILRAKDLRCMDGVKGDISQAIALVAHLSDEPVRVIDEMSAADFEVVSAIVEGFQSGPKTGPISSET